MSASTYELRQSILKDSLMPTQSLQSYSTSFKDAHKSLAPDDENFLTMQPRTPILRSTISFTERQNRKDSYGIMINRTQGSKQHKIKFKEEVKEVNVVENWKEYNVTEDRTCLCNMF